MTITGQWLNATSGSMVDSKTKELKNRLRLRRVQTQFHGILNYPEKIIESENPGSAGEIVDA
jgi:hypothetical protein